ncbi:MAG TPA: polysaccharide deacetylase family protein [Stellaceae bacterium]|nr:polysaccharide deacetylase family protein [Stellaceae bacterium]
MHGTTRTHRADVAAMRQPTIAAPLLLPPVSFRGHALTPIALGRDTPPLLQVIIDAEEEFDWAGPFDRRNVAVENLAHQEKAQRIFERYGIRPTYVVDYAVASQEQGFAPLRAILARDAADIGAHLQPWINPPFDDAIELSHATRYSFPGNLPPALEHAKLRALTERIEANLGIRPKVYRAGRYGIGASSFEIIEALGYEVDASVLPRIDLSDKGGADFGAVGPEPFWFGSGRKRLGIPLSAGFTGVFASCYRWLDKTVNYPLVEAARVKAAASRFGLFDRICLSPEGFTLAEQKRLTRRMLARGQRLFNLSYHSPSLLPGSTPYVRNEKELAAFLDRLEAYLVWFAGELGGCFTTPLEIKRLLEER